MSRYISDRPCPIHGVVVERYIKDNRCCACHADHQRKSRQRRIGSCCPRCGSTFTGSYCKPCHATYVTERQKVPCSDCGAVGYRNAAGKCMECSKPLFGRKVLRQHRKTIASFIQAINMQYGVLVGDAQWAGVMFDMKHHDKIIPFIMSLRG